MGESMGKYRGKSLKTGEWLYGGLINNLFFNRESKVPVCYILDCMKIGDYDCFEDLVDYFDDLEVDPDTVGEFTGLKNFYEGDKDRKYGDISFWKGIFGFGSKDPHDFIPLYEVWVRDDIEIVGTIHDKEKT